MSEVESQKLFLEDVRKLFPSNTFPPDPRDKVALETLDTMADHIGIYHKCRRTPPEKFEYCLRKVTDIMQRHAALYGLQWVYEAEQLDGWYLAPILVEEIDEN